MSKDKQTLLSAIGEQDSSEISAVPFGDQDRTYGGIESNIQDEQTAFSSNGADEKRERYYKAAGDFWIFFKYLIGLAVPILVALLIYYFSSIARPIGAMEANIENLQNSNKDFQQKVDNLQIELTKDQIEIENLKNRE